MKTKVSSLLKIISHSYITWHTGQMKAQFQFLVKPVVLPYKEGITNNIWGNPVP